MPAHKPNDRKTILSREQDAVIKDWGGRLPVALVYPNSYYLGMSNLGIHTIYHLLNSYSDVVCERVFHEKNNSRHSAWSPAGRLPTMPSSLFPSPMNSTTST